MAKSQYIWRDHYLWSRTNIFYVTIIQGHRPIFFFVTLNHGHGPIFFFVTPNHGHGHIFFFVSLNHGYGPIFFFVTRNHGHYPKFNIVFKNSGKFRKYPNFSEGSEKIGNRKKKINRRLLLAYYDFLIVCSPHQIDMVKNNFARFTCPSKQQIV